MVLVPSPWPKWTTEPERNWIFTLIRLRHRLPWTKQLGAQMINRLTFPASLAHVDDLRRQARVARVAAGHEARISRRPLRVRRVGASYWLPSWRWIHGIR